MMKAGAFYRLLLAMLLPTVANAAEKLSLLYAPTTGLMPSYIAKDHGIFEKHGLDVDLKAVDPIRRGDLGSGCGR